MLSSAISSSRGVNRSKSLQEPRPKTLAGAAVHHGRAGAVHQRGPGDGGRDAPQRLQPARPGQSRGDGRRLPPAPDSLDRISRLPRALVSHLRSPWIHQIERGRDDVPDRSRRRRRRAEATDGNVGAALRRQSKTRQRREGVLASRFPSDPTGFHRFPWVWPCRARPTEHLTRVFSCLYLGRDFTQQNRPKHSRRTRPKRREYMHLPMSNQCTN